MDLDFFGSFEPDALLIRSTLKEIGEYQIIQESKSIFQYVVNNVKEDFVNYPYDWISLDTREDTLVLAGIKDIAAMKLSAITNRGTKKNFIDIYELLGCFSLKDMFGFYQEKYADAIPFMTLKSLTWFKDAEEDPMPFMIKNYSWEMVKQRIAKEVSLLS